MDIFDREKLTQQEFRRKLARELIYNEYNAENITTGTALRPRMNFHEFVSVPRFHKINIKTGEQVPTKTEWLMRKCQVCAKRKKASYCTCDPKMIICRDCHTIHVVEAFSSA